MNPNYRFSKRARQILEVLSVAKGPMSFSEIRKKVVGITSDNDDWEFSVGLSRLEGAGLITSTLVKRAGFPVKVYQVPPLQKLAMIKDEPNV